MGQQMHVLEHERCVSQEPPGQALLRFVTFELRLATFQTGSSNWDSECHPYLDIFTMTIAVPLNSSDANDKVTFHEGQSYVSRKTLTPHYVSKLRFLRFACPLVILWL